MAESPFNTPRKIALFTASTVSVIMAVLIFLLLFLTDGQFNYWLLLVSPIIGFAATYVILKYAVERFIYDKIKIIYKTIHSSSTSAISTHASAVNARRNATVSIGTEVLQTEYLL